MRNKLQNIVAAVIMVLVLVATNCHLTKGWDVHAADTESNRLITVGSRTVTKDMKIADVVQLFGEPKLVTSSYWGGSAYTFYGEDYSDYLYLETDADGSIASYGSISEGFQTDRINYGDKTDGYVHIGMEAEKDGILYGIIGYTEYHADAYQIFAQDLVENNRSLCKHAVEMWNAISHLYGYNAPTTYDESLTNINVQLAENGSDWYDYCRNTSQGGYYQLCSQGTVTFPEYNYPNPLMFAEKARAYRCGEGYAQAFQYNVSASGSAWVTTGFINPDILQTWKVVPYTEEEQELLGKVRTEYMNSVETFNAQTSYYDIEPDYSALPLTGGKLSECAAKGAVGYLNSIRVGAGLNPLEYSEELSEAAQCKSTYTVYLSEHGMSGSDAHNPPQIEGITDEYYAKCQAGQGENLFMCGILSTNIIGSLTNALDDSYGTGQYYLRGHRYNLLDPYYQYIGVGNTLQQGCHKMSGYQPSDVEVVAWPSKGIMPEESGFSAGGMMTCCFYNGYKGTENTDVTIHCLNNDVTWTIEQGSLEQGQDIYVSGEHIAFKDSSVSFGIGGVYEITFMNLKNADGEDVSYTYRTVYESAYNDSSEESRPQMLNLSHSAITIRPGGIKRVKAVIAPESALNRRIHWESADTSVATVNECGEITALALGETTIIAKTEDGDITAACKVVVSEEEETVQGDVDGDGKVTLSDAQLTLKAALKLITIDEDKAILADVDGNGNVNLSDAQMILRIALKLPVAVSQVVITSGSGSQSPL